MKNLEEKEPTGKYWGNLEGKGAPMEILIIFLEQKFFIDDVYWCQNLDFKAPIIPHITHEGDPGNYDEYDEESWDEIREASEYVAKEFINW